MAFGALRGTLVGSSTNPGTGISATGSVSVTAGDLIVCNCSHRDTSSEMVRFSDNLGNAYQLLGAQIGGNGEIYGAWAYVKANGTLTSVAIVHASSTGDDAFAVAVFEGAFDPFALDVETLVTLDSTTPYTCPASGTLTQADEVIVGLQGQGNGGAAASYGATSPYSVALGASSGTGSNTSSGAIIYHLVSSTTGETPEVTSSASTSGQTKTVSFRKATTPAFGSCLGVFSKSQLAGSSSAAAVGFATVAVDDVIVVCAANTGTNIPSGGVSDNLGNSYTAQNAGTAQATVASRAWYSIATVAGNLTTVTVSGMDSAVANYAVAAAYKGASSGIDKNPANNSGSASPHSAPSTTTLSQADELIVSWVMADRTVLWKATSPSLTTSSGCREEDIDHSGVGLTMGHRVVAATTAVAQEFTTTIPFTAVTAGTMSFKKSTAGPTSWSGEATLSGSSTESASTRLNAAALATFAGSGTQSSATAQVLAAAATFNGAGSLSARVDKFIAASFAGTGSLSANASLRMQVSATFAGIGNFSAAVLTYKFGAATFSGVGSLSVDTVARLAAAARFNGSGDLSADSTVITAGGTIHDGAATLVGAGGLTASLQQVMSASATFAGAGNLSASAQDYKFGAATLQGAGSFSANANLRMVAAATFAGSGSLSASVNLRVAVFATFAGAGNLTVDAFIAGAVNQWSGEATFNGAGSLSVETKQVLAAAGTFSGTGSLSIATAQRLAAFATFAGASSLSVNALTYKFASATFSGVGGFSILANLRMQVATRFDGSGSLVCEAFISGAVNTWSGEAAFNGTGNMSVATTQALAAAATLSGASSLSVAMQEIMAIAATFQGSGSLSANVQIYKPLAATFQGSGSLSAYAAQIMRISATFAGIGSFSVDLVKLAKSLEATFSGSGLLSVSASQNKAVFATFSGAGTFSINVTARYGASVNFTGTGNLLCSVVARSRIAASFDGLGSFSAASVLRGRIETRFEGAGDLAADATLVLFGSNFAEARFGGQGNMFADLLQFGPRHVKGSRGTRAGPQRPIASTAQRLPTSGTRRVA